jgi:capsular polysaccharide transport system ATP-binding protein
MIGLFSVSDSVEVYGRDVELFDNVDFHLPPGRYALLSKTPEYHRAVLDILAGLRPPRRGFVKIAASISWPIGRQAFIRGKPTGFDLIDLVAGMHDLDKHHAGELVTLMVSRPDTLHEPVERWAPYVRQEFVFALGLVPEFDIYVIDGTIPYENSRFARMWQALFEQRLVGKTLILSTSRRKHVLDYCAKGLVYEGKSLRIENDLEGYVERYPARPIREELGNGLVVPGDSDGGDFPF